MNSPAQNIMNMIIKLYFARDASMWQHGDQFPDVMKIHGNRIRKIMLSKNVNTFTATNMLIKEIKNEYQQYDILAAAVELLEPSLPVQ